MTSKVRSIPLANAFLEDLSLTLDVDRTIKTLGITADEARGILKGLIAKEQTPSKALAHPPLKAGINGAYSINVDGASRGNPGRAGAGAVIKDPDGTIIRKLKKRLGVTTNNVAEYEALIMGLDAALGMGISNVSVHADSELMVKQINGTYKVKSPALAPLYEKAKGLVGRFSKFRISHVYREQNATADALANEALDG